MGRPRAERGADTFGTHYSEFEVEIGALPGTRAAAHPARDPRDALGRARDAVSRRDLRGQHLPDRTHRGDHHRLCRRRSSINLYGTDLDAARPRCAGGRGRVGGRARRARRPAAGAAGHAGARRSGCATSGWPRWGLQPLAVLRGDPGRLRGRARSAQVYRRQPRGRSGGGARRRESRNERDAGRRPAAARPPTGGCVRAARRRRRRASPAGATRSCTPAAAACRR